MRRAWNMAKHVLILDTSVLCCWLRVPGKSTAGPQNNRWDHARIDAEIQQKTQQGGMLVLPLATLIETGNHIAQAPQQRFACAQKLADCLRQAADAHSPWAAFTQQADLWQPHGLHTLAEQWPVLANGGLSIGDATIKQVAEYYAQMGCEVEILTGDEGLKAYQPAHPVLLPRRRR